MTHAGDEPIEIALIENNGYDRAVLDVCFSLDATCRLSYTKPDGSGPLDPSSLWHLLCQKEQVPDLVLFDLALTPWCGRVLARSSYRNVLKHSTQNVRYLEGVLRGLGSDDERRALVELTILLRAAVETPTRAREILSPGDPADRTWGTATEFVRKMLSRAIQVLAQPGELEPRLSAFAHELWKDEAAWDLSESPSVLRFLLCATSFPNVCFGVVSHFADQDTRDALRTILAARSPIPWPKTRDRLLDHLIVNKAELFASSEWKPGERQTLPDRLRESLQEWRTLGGPDSVSAPFCELPVEGGRVRLKFQEWCRDVLAASVGAKPKDADSTKCTMLLDQTLLVAGGSPGLHAWTCSKHAGWDSLAGGTPALGVRDLRGVVSGPSPWENRLYVVKEPTDARQLNDFLSQLGAGNRPAAPSCVILGSDDVEVVRGLQGANAKGDLHLYRIPPADKWPKKFLGKRGLEIARSLVENLRVELLDRVYKFPHYAKDAKEREKIVETIANFLLERPRLGPAYERFVETAPAMEGDLRDGLTADAVLLNHGFLLKAKLR